MSITRNTPYRDVGPVTLATWNNTVSQYRGRAALGSEKAWKAGGSLSAVLLRILIQESSVDTDYRANSKANNNPYNIRVKDRSNEDNPKGYVHFANLVDATDAARRRINGDAGFFDGPNPYAAATTIEELLYTYAPPQWNDTEGLITKMVDQLNAWLPDWSPPVTTPSTPPEPIPGEQETPVTVPQYLDYSSLSFPVEVRFIPASQTMQRPGYAMAPARTTWHDTGNPGARTNAESHARWMAAGCPDANGNPTYTSWHFTVDDGRAIQHIPLNEVAWHAGDGSNGPGNRTSIAIEECVNSDRNAAKTRANAAELHAFLIRELKLQGGTVNGCVQHNYWSGKNCPEVIRNAGLWPEMQRQMTARLGSTPTTPVYAEAAPVAKGSQVINGYVFLAPGGKTVQADVVPVKYADKDQPATGPALKKGTKLTQDQIGHYVVGTDGALWVELVDVPGVQNGSRIPALALIAA